MPSPDDPKADAMALLARRDYSRADLTRRLMTKGHSAEAVAGALDRLAEVGLQDDARVVDAQVRGRIRRGQGPLRIAHALRQQGLVQNAAHRDEDHPPLGSDLQQATDWHQQAEAVLVRRFGDEAGTGDRKAQAKQARFLAGRGFTPGQIGEALRRCQAAARSRTPDTQ